MAIVGVDSGSLYRRTRSLSRLAWSWVGGRLAPFHIHQMNWMDELWQWLCHDDSIININKFIIIIIIITYWLTVNNRYPASCVVYLHTISACNPEVSYVRVVNRYG